jgi:hypothetical protein
MKWDHCLLCCRGGLEQVKAIEPNAGVCGPAMKARWLVIHRAERTFLPTKAAALSHSLESSSTTRVPGCTFCHSVRPPS